MKNPIDSPSGEKNGAKAPFVSGKWPGRRLIEFAAPRGRLRAAGADEHDPRPDGEMASRRLPIARIGGAVAEADRGPDHLAGADAARDLRCGHRSGRPRAMPPRRPHRPRPSSGAAGGRPPAECWCAPSSCVGLASAAANSAAVAKRSAGSFSSAVKHRRLDAGRDRLPLQRERARLLGHDPRDDRLRGGPGEGRLPHQHLVRHAAQRVHVAPRRDLAVAHRLLGAHVVRRAEATCRSRSSGCRPPCWRPARCRSRPPAPSRRAAGCSRA